MNVTLNSNDYTLSNAPFASGGFFDVFKGADKAGKQVAVKILRVDLEQYSAGCEAGYHRQRLLNASGLFPHIFDLGICSIGGSNRFVVIEELITGESLIQSIDSKKFTRDEILNILKRVAYAIHILHGEDIIHRDLHSGNIMVTDSGRVLVVDFNTATVPGQHQSSPGSPAARIWGPYRDPSVRAHSDFTKKSDIYALGVVYSEQLIGETAARLTAPPYDKPDKFLNDIDEKLGSGSSPGYLRQLVKAMIEPQPSNRPDTSAILQTLESGRFQRRLDRALPPADRDRSFGFIRNLHGRLEVFIRTRDMDLLNVPPRTYLQLAVLNPAGSNEEHPHMLVTPQRYIKSDKIIMFARINLPNAPGVFSTFVAELEGTGHYRVFDFRASRGFRHSPGTSISLTIGQDKKHASDIASYLDPLAQQLRSCIFKSVRDHMVAEGMEKDWEQWNLRHTYENAVTVSATLTQAYHGRFVQRYYTSGYLGSTQYVDTSNDRYAVIRGVDLIHLVPNYFADLKDGFFYPLRVVPDGEHRDLVLQLIGKEPFVLIRLHTRCLMPADQSPNFVGKFLGNLNKILTQGAERVIWNIETFEMRDGWIGGASEPLCSIRVSVHITSTSDKSFDVEKERNRMISEIEKQLRTMNGRSIEVFASPLFGDEKYCAPSQLLKFAT